MKKKIIFLVVLTALATVLIFLYSRSSKKEKAVMVSTGMAEYGYIANSITATGTIQPVDTVSVGAQISGVVKAVYADFNSMVKQGQLLARIDPSIISLQREEAIANLAQVKHNLEFQQSNFDRFNKLFKSGAVSASEYEIAENQLNSAKSAIGAARAQLKITERNLSYTKIYSPITGVVLDRNVSAGQTIASSFNAPTLFVIAKDLTRMRVRAAVDEADIGLVKAGQYVTFTVDAFPNDVFEGVVQEILLHPAVSANVVTYTTLINVENKEMKLKPGMTAGINIYTEEDSNALLIPSRALSFKPGDGLASWKIKTAIRSTVVENKPKAPGRGTVNGSSGDTGAIKLERGSSVWIRKGDTLEEKLITTGMNNDSYVKVLAGLNPGDELVTGIVKNNTNGKSNNTKRSPFVPQLRRRPATTTRN